MAGREGRAGRPNPNTFGWPRSGASAPLNLLVWGGRSLRPTVRGMECAEVLWGVTQRLSGVSRFPPACCERELVYVWRVCGGRLVEG